MPVRILLYVVRSLRTRCTQDIQSIDGPLVRMGNHFIAQFVMCMSRLVAVMISAPVFVVPAAAIGAIGAGLGQVYIKAQLSIKRERSIAKVGVCRCCRVTSADLKAQAPVLAAINGAFSGLSSIRAYDAQAMFTAQSMEKVDNYTHGKFNPSVATVRRRCHLSSLSSLVTHAKFSQLYLLECQ
jgi:ABC-type multidrug transport system fused ATPase/permease subunit